MNFFKGHGLGNDYLALEWDQLPLELTPATVRLLCDRHRGIGSDGILARVPATHAEFGLRIFNPDGSEAEKSGNGLRIFAAYLLDRGEVEVGRAFRVATAGGTVGMRILEESADGWSVEVEMGRASFLSTAVGLTGPEREVAGEPLELESGNRIAINTVSLGNPHCVVWDDDLDPEALRRVAPLVSTHPWFQRGTNVQFARVAGPAALEAWVWERGAGETLASGSSACAVASVAVRRGLVAQRELEVRMPGGSLYVGVSPEWDVTLRGAVEGVYRGELTPGFVRRLQQLS